MENASNRQPFESMAMEFNSKSIVRYRLTRDGKEVVREVKGLVGRTLIALVEAGASGVTAYEMPIWASRYLADCVYELRHAHLGGKDAIDSFIQLTGDPNGYILMVEVKILTITFDMANHPQGKAHQNF